MRNIFIWDIHWCYDELLLLLEKINYKKDKDNLYFVWDMINKWNYSYEVLDFAYRNNVICIKWNHELWFLDFNKWQKEEYRNNIYEELQTKLNKNTELFNFLNNLPLYIEKDDFILLHWWLINNKSIENHTPDEITNTRYIENIPWYKLYKGDKKIIYGHWAVDWIQKRKKTIWLDSACVYWWYLSAYILETDEIIQQRALNIYFNPYN